MRRRSEQFDLDRLRHGGRRPGAGRKSGPNPRIRHRSRERFGRLLPAHERSFARGCERGSFRLVHYSLQGNHAHLIVEAIDREALVRGMKSIGARLARAVNRVCARKGPVLADRYHARLLRTPREVRNALAYVLMNARRHAARAGRTLSRAFGIDPASSGRWFDGWTGTASHRELTPRGARPIAPPRGWLLVVGWKRYRTLDPLEVPGD